MSRRKPSRVRQSFLGALLVSAAVGIASPAAAASTCVRTGDVLDVSLDGANTPFENFTLARELSGDITLTRNALLSNTPIDCGDATASNVNTIEVSGTEAIETLFLDLQFGFTPGQTPEGSGLSEIEIDVDLGGGLDTAIARGSDGSDVYVMGTKGMNVWNDSDGDDIQFGASVEVSGMAGLGGPDQFSANGGSGTGGPTISPVAMVGGPGNDRLRGGSGSDYISGVDDDDVLIGGAGNDRMGADVGPVVVIPNTELGEDTIRGGPGGDVIRGGGDEDRIDGGPGDDDEHGSDADDIFLQGRSPNGADHLFGGEGQDEVRYESRNASVNVTLDNKRNDGAGGERDSVGFKGDLEDVTGGRADDVIKGNGRPNVLKGQAGADLLVGKGGVDTCRGGPGSDDLRTCD